MTTIPVFIRLECALRQLGWVAANAPSTAIAVANHDIQTNCWFRYWLADQATTGPLLNARGRESVQRLVAAGWTLRSCWPRSWNLSIANWVGERMVLGHASLFSPSTHLHSLLSSRIGRHGSGRPDWPGWIDAACQHISHHRGRLLVTPGTTLADWVGQFASCAHLPVTVASWTQHSDLEPWLVELLSGLGERKNLAHDTPSEKLYISPLFEQADSLLAAEPLQDRLAIALADRVWLLSMRKGGTLEKLIRRRLGDQAFPAGSVFVTLPSVPQSSTQVSRPRAPSRDSSSLPWLERGAVGWFAATRSQHDDGPLRHCHASTHSSDPVQQLVGPFPPAWRNFKADEVWPYLVHCTRGLSGPHPEESEESFRQRVWSLAEVSRWHPLETLTHICRQRRLRGTARITRTAERSVSFSAVPIVPLLARRTFRSHLGRWDWEPYGLLIRREALQSVGARQVIYGEESDFEKLDSADRPFFQPHWRKMEQPEKTWAEEREWRVLGDVELRWFSSNSVIVFVRTPIEAQQLARFTDWPVLWLGDVGGA